MRQFQLARGPVASESLGSFLAALTALVRVARAIVQCWPVASGHHLESLFPVPMS